MLLVFYGYKPKDTGCMIKVNYKSYFGLFSKAVSHIYDDELLAIAL